tara:strand:- start:225 stop:398 length:174 start_codon:yes stop_codon:yes gene_type:complete
MKEVKKATPISSNISASIIPDELASHNDIADCRPVRKALLNINFQYDFQFVLAISYP